MSKFSYLHTTVKKILTFFNLRLVGSKETKSWKEKDPVFLLLQNRTNFPPILIEVKLGRSGELQQFQVTKPSKTK